MLGANGVIDRPFAKFFPVALESLMWGCASFDVFVLPVLSALHGRELSVLERSFCRICGRKPLHDNDS